MGTALGQNTGFRVSLVSSATVSSGTLWGCGYNGFGGLGDGTTVNGSTFNQIGSLANWSKISCSYASTGAIKTDGTLWTWGQNKNVLVTTGQLGNGTSINYSSPIQIGSLTNWSSVALGGYHFIATKTDGTLWACGYNRYGQLGNGTGTYYSSPIQIGSLTTWSKISAGASSGHQSFAIKTDGTLWAWGQNQQGQLGNGTRTDYSSPIQIGSLTNWSQVSSGTSHTAAIKTDGTLWTWGFNQFGTLGNQTSTHYSSPIQIGSLTNWSQIYCGGNHTVALKTDGTLWTWGYNSSSQLGNGTTITYLSPIQIGSLTNWSKITAGSSHTAAIKTDGTLWAWGRNNYYQLGNGSTTNYSSPVQIGSLSNWGYVAAGDTTFAIPSSNQTVTYGQDTYYANTLWGWGLNTYGNIGDGTIINKSSPIQIGLLTTWSKISQGEYTTLAIKTDGTLWAWGSGGIGNLGNGTTISYSSPIQIGSLNNWSKVTSLSGHALAIKTDGTLWTWGYNIYGQLGNGTVENYSSPIQIGSLTTWSDITSITGGSIASAAIKTDGTLWMWGYNAQGQLGNGTRVNYSSPIQVGSLTNWSKVAAGGATLAVKTDGTLWGWGYNQWGQVGNGTQTHYSSPIQIGSLTNWSKVAVGFVTSAAIKTDGTLWTWGQDSNGQLGLGSTAIVRLSPSQVGTLTNWKNVVCGYYQTIMSKTDGTLWSCGYNGTGQLGNGTTTSYSSPIQIGSLNIWNEIGGYRSFFAIPSLSVTIQAQQDLGQRYVSKDYLLDVYPNIASATGARTSPGLWVTGGFNRLGHFGINNTVYYSSPIQVGSLTDWKQVDGGTSSYGTTMAIKTNGSLWGMGYNGYGVLGNGNIVDYSSPIQIGSLTNWKQVSVGNYGGSAIKTNGTLWSWGNENTFGNIGNGTTAKYLSPIQIGSLTDWKWVSRLSDYTTAAIKTDGKLWVWGRNEFGQLGNGTTISYSSPIQVGSSTNWKQITLHGFHVSAIKTDGTLWTWGYNANGQLGNGTTIRYSSPIQIGSLTNWKYVQNGGGMTAAIKTDGTLWTWGSGIYDSAYGHLGNGTIEKYSSPIQIGSLTNWKQVIPMADSDSVIALKTDGTMWVWGMNNRGQLGNGTRISYSSPIQIGSLTNWKEVFCGYQSAFAIADGYY